MSSEPLLANAAGDPASPTTGGATSASSSSLYTAAQVVRSSSGSVAARPKKTCCRLPVVLDLAGERVRSRWLSVVIFIQVMTVLGVLVFTAVLKDSVTGGRVTNLVMSNRPVSAVGIGRYATAPLRVRVTNEKGFGAEGISAVMTLMTVSPTTSATDICADYVFGDPSVPRVQNLHGSMVREICEPVFEGTTGSTDLDGVIEFAKFRLVRGPPGIYAIRVTAHGQLTSDVMYDFATEINGLTCVNPVSFDMDHLGFTLGQPLRTAPVFQVSAARGRPLGDRTVIAFVVGRIRQIGSAIIPMGSDVQFREMVGPDKAAALATGTTMVTTNATGYAVFNKLAILGATSPANEQLQVMIAFYCEGVTSLLFVRNKRDPAVIPFAPVLRALDVSSVSGFDTPTSDMMITVEEGVPFTHDLRVIIPATSQSPVGKIVWAMISAVNGIPVSGTTSYVGDPSSKNLMSPQSNPIASTSGTVTFTNLQFSITGEIGIYTITYVCEGVTSAPYRVNVTSTINSVRIVASEGWPTSVRAMDTMLEKLPRIFVNAKKASHSIAQTVELIDLTGRHMLNWTAEPTDSNGVTFLTSLRIIPVCQHIVTWNASRTMGCDEFTHVNISARVDGVLSDTYVTIMVNSSAITFYNLLVAGEGSDITESANIYMGPRVLYLEWITPPPTITYAYFPINATLRVVSVLGRSVPYVSVCPLLAPEIVTPHIMMRTPDRHDPCVESDHDGYVTLVWHIKIGYNSQHRLYAQVQNPSVESFIPANGWLIQLPWVTSTIVDVTTKSYSSGLHMVRRPKPSYQANEWINFTLSETFDVIDMPAEVVADFLTQPPSASHRFQPDIELVREVQPASNLVATIDYATRMAPGNAGLYEFVVREVDDGAMISPLLRLKIASAVTQIRWAPESKGWSNGVTDVYLGAAHPFTLSANRSMNLQLLDSNGDGVANHIIIAMLQEIDGSDQRGVLGDVISSTSGDNGMVTIEYLSLVTGTPGVIYSITFLILSNEILPLAYSEVFRVQVSSMSYVEVRTSVASTITLGQPIIATIQLIPHNNVPPLRQPTHHSCYVPMDIMARAWNDSLKDYSTTVADATVSWYLTQFDCGIGTPMLTLQEIDDGTDTSSIVSSNATFMAQYTLYDLSLVNGAPTKYRLEWSIPGVSAWFDPFRYRIGLPRSRPLQLSPLDVRLEIVSQPYVGEIGYPMRFGVKATNGINGVLVSNVVIKGAINYNEWYRQQAGDSSSNSNDAAPRLITSDRLTLARSGAEVTPSLSSDSGIAITGQDGIAYITMLMTEGFPATSVYPFAFTSPSSIVGTLPAIVAISVSNPVALIVFITQPSARDGDAVQVKLADSGTLNSMIQPVLRVLGPSGLPVIGVMVDVFVIRNGVVQPDEWIRYTPAKTDDKGVATFNDVAFLDSSASSTYNLRFKVCGVANDSTSFKVHNDLSIEEERLDMFKDITYAVMGFMIPLFMANSQFHSWWWSVVGFVVSVAYTSIGMYINLTQLAAQGERKDVFGVLLRTLSIINLLVCTIGFAWLIIRQILITKLHMWLYTNDVEQRDAENEIFVARLFKRGVPRVRKVKGDDDDEEDKKKQAGVVARLRDWCSTCSSQADRDHTNTVDKDDEAADAAIAKEQRVARYGANGDQKDGSGAHEIVVDPKRGLKSIPYHDITEFEGDRVGFRYPQRLLFAIALTLVLLFISLLGCIVFLRWLAAFIAKARAFLIGLQFRDDTLDLGYIIEMGHQIYHDISDATSIGDFLKKGGATMGLVSMLLKMWNVSTDSVNLIGSIIVAAGGTAAVLSYLFMVMSLWLILRNYKQFALALRHGDYTGVTSRSRKRTDIGLGNAAGLVGLMIWRFTLSFVSSFFFLFLVSTLGAMCYYISSVWAFFFGKIQNILLGLSITYLIVRVVLFVVGKYVVQGSSIAHRRCFALYDFALLFIGFASGLLSAVTQFVTAILMVFVNFPRVDLETYHGDSGFGSFLAMLRTDHEFNSPVVSRALCALHIEAQRVQQGIVRVDRNDLTSIESPSSSNVATSSSTTTSMRLMTLSGTIAAAPAPSTTTSNGNGEHKNGESSSSSSSSLVHKSSSQPPVVVSRDRALQRLRVLYALTANPLLLHDEGLRK